MAKNISRNIGFFLLIISLIMTSILTVIQNRNNKSLIKTEVKKSIKEAKISISYPLQNSILPPDIAAPTFKWNSNFIPNYWRIKLCSNKKVFFDGFIDLPYWRPDSILWENIKRNLITKKIDFTVSYDIIVDSIQHRASDTLSINFSKDSVVAPIFFRHVDLPFQYAQTHIPDIEWCLGEISSYHPARVLLTRSNTCGNCHSFSQDGSTMGIDFDYQMDKGGYAVFPIEPNTKIKKEHFHSWNALSKQKGNSTGFLSSLSPNGKFVASTVNDQSITNLRGNTFRFFPVRGQIGIYDISNGKSWLLPGASDSLFVQCNPTWSPDGNTIIFSRSRILDSSIIYNDEERKEYSEGSKYFGYDLYRIPFNNGEGGVASPVKGASNNEKSNYFPKVSPDGKWIVFTQAKSYMLRQPDSKLAIVPFEGGESRVLGCNTNNMNSWHSWSPNSRWLVFSTKALSPYTKIAISHIDTLGYASPPLIIENMSDKQRAANIPEFVNIKKNSWMNVHLGFMEPSQIKNIDLYQIGDGKYYGDAIVTGELLKPLKIEVEVSVVDHVITSIRILKTNLPNQNFDTVTTSILKKQTINPNIIDPKSSKEKAILLAVGAALEKATKKAPTKG